MISEELNSDNLSDRIKKAKQVLLNTKVGYLNCIKNNKKVIQGNKYNEELVTLCSDLWELKEKAAKIPNTSSAYSLAEKVICLWKNDICPLLNEVDSLIKKYNSISGDNISSIEERIGIPIRESCFGY